MTNTPVSDELGLLVDGYTAVWNEPDAQLRRLAIEGLWAADGVEYVEGARFGGPDELDARVTEAHNAFVQTACTARPTP